MHARELIGKIAVRTKGCTYPSGFVDNSWISSPIRILNVDDKFIHFNHEYHNKSSTLDVSIWGNDWEQHGPKQSDMKDMRLDQLIQVANEGYRAIELLYSKHRDQLEYRNGSKDWKTFERPYNAPNGMELRIAEAKTTKIGSNTVTVSIKEVKVGCQKFNRESLQNALVSIYENGNDSTGGFSTSVHYIRYNGHSVTHDEAKELLKFLKAN